MSTFFCIFSAQNHCFITMISRKLFNTPKYSFFLAISHFLCFKKYTATGRQKLLPGCFFDINYNDLRAPVGQASTHLRQSLQKETVSPLLNSGFITVVNPRPTSPSMPLPTSSSHTRTQRLHRMHLFWSLSMQTSFCSFGQLCFSPKNRSGSTSY